MIIEDSLYESVKPSKILGIKKIKRRSQAVPGYPTTKEEFQINTLPVLDLSMQTLLVSMNKACIKANGAALAAPQVGVYFTMFIITNPDDPKAFRAIFNPAFEIEETITVLEDEGCLSIPNLTLPVRRNKKINARWFEFVSTTGVNQLTLKEEILTDFSAKLFQHEMEHFSNGNIVESSALSREQKRKIMNAL